MVSFLSLRMVCSAALVSLLVLALSSRSAFARSVDGVGRLEKLLSSSSSSSGSSSPLDALGGDHSVNKRDTFDHSCKGIYDRELFRKLDRVCEDCYNLYRKPYVATECKSNCFVNKRFNVCVADLRHDVSRFLKMAKFLRYP
ncbi:molt-inhibiting hormone-like isoform X2 [Penaeus vannamei]|uniref:Hyperglycemic hormone-like peptide n=3 Tax=Penaeus vannamei TaxID=6689 RepID=K7SGP4_PENVA|nr:molt-inhibiting hormone-like isoform X2 [Penaeus vannamei]AFV95080.1 hyperglycemic hormone-like peptide precursor [Penaeus vannamei]ROT68740.1 hyperglycemic hormone-like peptide precursor [Penaeus vannamei]